MGLRKLSNYDDHVIWKEQERDLELEKIIGNLLMSESQENKLQRTLADRLDPYNPAAFSKEYSDYTFNHAGKSYRISVRVEKIDINEKEEKKTLSEKVMTFLPTFGIMAIFFLTAFLTIFINDTYFNGSGQVAAFLANDESIAQMLEKCGSLVILENPHPRLSIALYAACDKQIKQIQEFCKTNSASNTVCSDERINKYLVARRLLK